MLIVWIEDDRTNVYDIPDTHWQNMYNDCSGKIVGATEGLTLADEDLVTHLATLLGEEPVSEMFTLEAWAERERRFAEGNAAPYYCAKENAVVAPYSEFKVSRKRGEVYRIGSDRMIVTGWCS